MARVIVHAFILVDALGRPDLAVRAWAAAHVHDLGRRHDGVCFEHGRYALERLPSLPRVQATLAEGGVGENDWEEISTAVDHHCRAELSKTHPHWVLTAILKDADGLDRVRLGDLDPRYFRFSETRGLVPFAETLFENTDAALRPGADYFAALWPIAQQLLEKTATEKRA